jgi:hypothetical protein
MGTIGLPSHQAKYEKEGLRQGLTLVHFSAQPKPFWSHLPVSP